MVALQPISATTKYTLFHTSPTFVNTEFQPYQVDASGAQTLTVSASNPLLYNLTVSLEWDARANPNICLIWRRIYTKTMSRLLYMTGRTARLRWRQSPTLF
ncbi:MAG: hypothetical protein R2911_23265 [Caldilineaceae bacterium]